MKKADISFIFILECNVCIFCCFVSVLVNTQTFLGEDKCSEVGDGIEQSEDAELQPLLPLLHPTALD